ncbi:helix-turn-helix domain-containing protein [Paremcibacter congregatus]|uniref:Transcriptional regulator n=1 Tax=Paremcibacter congregatus TaxID=2043170 RepID=A0A2G4YNY8_9PROT|nr:helix-turn-helix transcriptional regulator [Paremcibacter congregatus]PHZ84020.1 transcriptional regulator [Paremcibacter congregatus]PHZ85462.1 transcriptional regulator [Paremcibacter congregatus]QDE26279.1 helix-turn-helix transcriptional regulator [Paremcibacter congregatus]QDE28014.1 helix-turn-helix transcriptional regulator [Paremcibacter congregatus]
MSLAVKLKELRLRKKQSLQQVADAIGISKTHVYDLEKGNSKNPSVDLLKQYSNHFGVPVNTLIGEDLADNNADPELVRMFRQVGELGPEDKQLLDSMIKTMLDRQKAKE